MSKPTNGNAGLIVAAILIVLSAATWLYVQNANTETPAPTIDTIVIVPDTVPADFGKDTFPND